MKNRKKPDPKRDKHTPHPGKTTRVEKKTSVEKIYNCRKKNNCRRKKQI